MPCCSAIGCAPTREHAPSTNRSNRTAPPRAAAPPSTPRPRNHGSTGPGRSCAAGPSAPGGSHRWDEPRCYWSRVASSVIGVACNAPETGHPSLAAWAIRWKSASSMPGTEATVRRWIPVMPVPATNDTWALVRTEVGVVPFWSSSLDSARKKHADGAAAGNSSGLVVPEAGSVLAFQLTSKVARPDVLSSALPEPEPRSPLQELVAVVVTGVGMRSSEWSWLLCPPPSCTRERLLAQRQAPATRRRTTTPCGRTLTRRRTTILRYDERNVGHIVKGFT